jgi:hypothetical protein
MKKINRMLAVLFAVIGLVTIIDIIYENLGIMPFIALLVAAIILWVIFTLNQWYEEWQNKNKN